MPSVTINLWGVVAATAFAMVLGALWYSPVLFYKQWAKLVGKKASDMQKGAGQMYVLTALLWLLTAYIMAHAVAYVAADTWLEGAVTGFWAWAGFVLTTNLIHGLFQGTAKKLMAINVGYSLVALVGMGTILVLLPN